MKFYTNAVIKSNSVWLKGYDDKGKSVIKEMPDDFECYIKSNNSSSLDRGVNGEKLEKYKFDRINEFFDFCKKYKEDNAIEPYGVVSPLYQVIQKNWPQKIDFDLNSVRIFYIDIETQTNSDFDGDFVRLVNEADREVLSISIKDSKTGNFYVLSTVDFDKEKIKSEILKNNISKDKIQFKKLDSEADLLVAFIYIVKKAQPYIFTGWNVEFFDIPLLCNRITRKLGREFVQHLSPFGVSKNKRKVSSDNRVIIYDDPCIQILDYMELYKKFTYKNRESYSLNYISSVELKLEKLKSDNEKAIFELHESNPQLFVEYNIWDVELVSKLNDKLKLLDLAITISYKSGILFQDVFSPVKTWDILIYRYLKNKNLQTIPNEDHFKVPYPGAYVKTPEIGFHKWVMAFDLNSLYPNLGISCNLSNEVLVDNTLNFSKDFDFLSFHRYHDAEVKKDFDVRMSKLVDEILFGQNKDFDLAMKYAKENNLVFTINKSFWKKEPQGVISVIMEEFYNNRVEIQSKIKSIKKKGKKKEEYIDMDLSQTALKYLLNSGYGGLANEYFRYFNTKLASSFTMMAQIITLSLEKYLNKVLDHGKVIYADTDSIYVCLDDYVLAKNLISNEEIVGELLKYKNVIFERINECLKLIGDKFNFCKNTLEMKMEFVASIGLWCAKKNYVLRMITDGDTILEKPTLKMMGIQVIRSSTPDAIRSNLTEFIDIVLDNDFKTLVSKIKEYKEKFFKMSPQQIAFPRSLTNLTKWFDPNSIYIKATPIHVRGALIYNHYIDKLKLINNYSPIKNGDKIKFLYLKMPNPFHENVISFLNDFPSEFNLEQYIDYDLQFEKTFIAPLNNLTSAYGKNLIRALNFSGSNILSFFS